MTREEQHRLGLACAQLLSNDSFKLIIGKIREDLTNAWLSCGLAETEKQTHAKMAMTGLDMIMTKIVTYSDAAKIVNEEMRVAQEKIDRAQAKADAKIAKLAELGITR